MSLTATEEAILRELIGQQAALLSLAEAESQITLSLGAEDTTLSDLEAVSSISEPDLFLLRQGTEDKSVTAALIKTFSTPSAASTTSKGIVELATSTETTTGTDTTRAVTPAGLQSKIAATLDAVYPVGSIYLNASNATSPAILFGFGTWAEFGAGRVMVGLNASDALFDTLEETGGSKDAVVVSHTHSTTVSTKSLTGSIVGISESFAVGGGATSGVFTKQTGTTVGNTPVQHDYGDGGGVTFDGSHDHTVTNAYTGSSGTNANVQPYIVVKMWRRTA